MKIVFYGSRGSNNVSSSPQRLETIAKNIFTLTRKNPRAPWAAFKKLLGEMDHSFAGVHSQHTTCVELCSDMAGMPLFLDMGTGLHAASIDPRSGLNNSQFKRGKGECAFFLSHTHWDHVIGLPTLLQIHRGDNKFHFYGCHPKLERRIAKLFDRDFFPVPYASVAPRFHFHQLRKNELLPFGKIRIQSASQSHPGTSYAYRFEENGKSFVFATDTDLANTFLSHFHRGSNIYSNADLLAMDSHFSREDFELNRDYGHPSFEMVVDFAVRENVKKVLFIHHNPFYSDTKLDSVLKRAKQYLAKKYGPRHPLALGHPIESELIKL
jgi:phosphoribosyl 1,2-cyclic phosphodiesterase